MTELYVSDMMCAHCVKRITDGLTRAGLRFTVQLESKTVTVEGDAAACATALRTLDDLGFDAVVRGA